ncbi:MAG: tetratricopeptide repeat protein [Acidobacteriaceae bacterium]|nr:tetratricopeptide repeat protein [Acidobacteriaceae bacterium]
MKRLACLALFVTGPVFLASNFSQAEDAYQNGKTALDSKDYAQAERLFGQAEEQHPGATNAAALRAKALIHLNRFEDAERSLKDYVRRHPESPDGAYLLGYVLFRENKAGESLQVYTAASRLQRPSSSDFKIVGLDYALLGDYSSAIKWLELAVIEGPKDAEAVYHLGRVYYIQNSFDKAIACFKQVLQLDPQYVKAEDNLGLAYEGKNELNRAEAAYREAIRIGTQTGHVSEGPYLNLADLLCRRGRNTDALKLLDTADQVGDKSARSDEIRARIFFGMNRLPEAESELRSALTTKPQDGALHYLLGRVLKREGKADEAEKEFAQTRKLLGTHSSSLN